MAVADPKDLTTWSLGLSTTAMLLLFGTNCILYVFFLVMKRLPTGRITNIYEQVMDKDTDEDEDDKVKGAAGANKVVVKKLSEPFVGTLDCFTNLTRELFWTGCLIALTYVCEKHWYADHLGKVYDRDLFMFVLLVFFGYAYLTTKKVDDVSLLSPDQTLEWKGWMQFIFLLYHYFHAEEVYNSVRVMITCYVWMTGFGQFSSFYTKQDFSWLKVSHNLWRLNFAVLLLMWTHGNSYILYYICPMHTFYFLMVYVTMYLYSSVNHSKWGIRYKVLALGLIIYVVWDINGGLFDFIFAWLGTDSVVGATNGSVWEYYFRTSLDHWSAYLGMVFALNFPMADQFFNKVRGWPLVGTSVVMVTLSVWWYLVFYCQDKMAYNLTHSYFAIIPLTVYIFFRNVATPVRRYISYSLVDLGKTTLETYLLQHHIWLTSNAKTLLNITPGYPWVNFFLASALFLVCSKELYRVTTSLRGMLLPDEKFPEGSKIAIHNLVGMCAALLVCLAVASVLFALEASILETLLSCLGLFLACLLVISRFSKAVASQPVFQLWLPRATYTALALLFAGIMTQIVFNGMVTPPARRDGLVPLHRTCLDHISHGRWVATKCPDTSTASGGNPSAFCETDSWVWEPLTEDELAWAERTQATPPCPVGRVSSSLAKTALKNKRVLFAGDSIMRNTYHAFNGLLDPSYRWNSSVSFRHGNLVQHVKTSNTSVAFYWAPFVRNITAVLDTLGGSTSEGAHGFDLFVSGAAAWDALYIRSPTEYSKDLSALSARLRQARPSSPGVTVWMQPTTIVDNRLSSLEKQQHMSEKTIAVYRGLFEANPVRSGFSVTIDATGASRGREGATVDGVHYSEDIYKVISQLCVNAYTLHFPRLYVKTPARKVGKAKATGPMSFPSYGIIVLVAAALMLYTMDPFLGVAWLVQRVVGVTEQQASDMTWEVAYREIHRKNHISHPTSSSSSSGGGGGGGGGGGSRGGSERGGDSDRETEALKDSQQLEMAPASGGGEGSRA